MNTLVVYDSQTDERLCVCIAVWWGDDRSSIANMLPVSAFAADHEGT